jgi:hypothetical protein
MTPGALMSELRLSVMPAVPVKSLVSAAASSAGGVGDTAGVGELVGTTAFAGAVGVEALFSGPLAVQAAAQSAKVKVAIARSLISFDSSLFSRSDLRLYGVASRGHRRFRY